MAQNITGMRSHFQGITGKKESYKKTGFDEDDRADERGSAGTNQLLESVRVVERVEKMEDGVEHSVLFLTEEESIEFLTGTGAGVRERTAATAPNPIR